MVKTREKLGIEASTHVSSRVEAFADVDRHLGAVRGGGAVGKPLQIAARHSVMGHCVLPLGVDMAGEYVVHCNYCHNFLLMLLFFLFGADNGGGGGSGGGCPFWSFAKAIVRVPLWCV